MNSNEFTLAESVEESLLRAGFGHGPNFAHFLVTHLDAGLPRQRILALRGSVRQGLMNAERWLRALQDRNPVVRREALRLLAYESVTDTRIFDAVRSLLHDEDPLVVDAAVFVIGEHVVLDGVDELCQVAEVPEDARCRESAIAALGAIGDERGRATILRSLEDKPPVRRRAIVALVNFEGPDIEEALERASDDRDWQVRAAVNQLGRDFD